MSRLDKAFVVVALLPIILLSGLASLLAANIDACYEYNDKLSIRPEDGYPYEYLSSNLSFLLSRAWAFERLISLYHLPFGTLVNALFNSTAANASEAQKFDLFNPDAPEMKILAYTGLGDSAIWTGVYLASEAFRYAVAKATGNETDAKEALQNIRWVVKGIWRLVMITGDGSLARFAAPLTPEAKELLGDFFEKRSEEEVHEYWTVVWDDPEDYAIWGTKLWRWEGTTSKDQYSGIFFGLATAYDLVPVDDVRRRITEAVDAMLEYFRRTNWKSLHQNYTHSVGSDLQNDWYGSGLFLLSFLKVGAHILPEKWGRLYYYYAVDKGYAWTLIRAYNKPNINWQYYGLNLNFLAYFNLLRLEEDKRLREIYLEAFLRTNWDLVKFHRNAWFDMVYMSQTGNWSRLYVMDVVDSLTRLALYRFPSRNYLINNTNLSENPVEEGRGLDLGPLNPIFQGVTECRPHTRWPLPADRREPATFTWEKPPFTIIAGGDGREQYPGIDYTLVFWMSMYFGLFDRAREYGIMEG